MPRDDNEYNRVATEYDPIKIGSIDGTDSEPHDRAILCALYSEYAPNKQVKGNPKHTLFIGRLNRRTTQETIHSEFSKFGKILHCRLVKDIVTGKSKQYAFVEYENIISADTAFKEMHAEYLDGSEIIVEREAERRLVGWRPRRLGGGFGGRKESGQLRFGCRERPFRKPIITGLNINNIPPPVKSATEHNDTEIISTTQEANVTLTTISMSSTNRTTLRPFVECTWKSAERTDAIIHYYENVEISTWATPSADTWSSSEKSANSIVASVQIDGQIVDKDNVQKAHLLALGKVNLPQDVTFGCVLTIISKYCTLTAASCIESVEEVDTVDSFVIIEEYGDRYSGRIHIIADVLINPEYQGINKKYDVAVIKSEDSLLQHGQAVATLPSTLDALAITVGEQFTLLWYGTSRLGGDEMRRALRVLTVRTMANAQCEDTWAPRHLARGAAECAGACGPPQLCAGPLRAPSACSPCAGAPLLRGPVLVAVASGHCGDACEPAHYVNVGTLVDWLIANINVE